MRTMKFFLFFSMMFLFLSINITYSYQSALSKLSKVSQSFYSENALFFVSSDMDIKFNELLEIMPINSVFYLNFISDDDVRGILFKGNYIAPDLQKGRFFKEEDFNNFSKLAVVGNKVITYIRENKVFVEWDGAEYEVIGTIGYGYSTRLDYTIMLTLNDELIKRDVYRYIIDGQNLQDNFNFLGNQNHFGQVVVYDKSDLNLLNIIDKDNMQLITSVLFVLSILFNSLLMISFIIDNKANDIKLKKIIGFTNGELLVDLHKDIDKLLIIGFISGLLISAIYIINKHNSFSAMQVVMNLLSLSALLGYIHVLIRKKINQVLVLKWGEEN